MSTSSLWLVGLGLLGAMAPVARADVFAPFVHAPAPQILRTVDAPGEAPAGVRVQRLVFASVETAAAAGGERPVNEVYAVIARPEPAGGATLPGLLLLHGGGGAAEEPAAIAWARRGYVAVSLDLPGIAHPDKAPHSTGAWKQLPYGEGRWTVQPDATASTIYQGVAAALQAFALLRSQPGVDAARIGVTGTSWGGYTTTMVCGILGPQVRAGFSNYGTGFYEDTTFKNVLSAKMNAASRAVWLAELDAGRRAPGITAPFFIAGAANDTFFYPPAVEKTLAAIPGPVNRLHAPNAHHRLPVPGGTTSTGGAAAMAETWFARHLQGRGGEFPVVELEPAGTAGPAVTFRVRGPQPVTAAAVWHSAAPAQGGWPKREWKQVPATPLGEGRYEAVLPSEALAPGAAWFALVSDDRPVSVSSPLVLAGK